MEREEGGREEGREESSGEVQPKHGLIPEIEKPLSPLFTDTR
jgi:hypothetical protein